MSSVAIITARGGSKRIPRKNIKSFMGRPMLSYAIEAAKESGLFSEIMVSTDDGEIAEIARTFGANVPFMRSDEASGDHSTTADVMCEVLLAFASQGRKFEEFACIYPCVPFLTGVILSSAFSKLKESKADALIPVVRYSFPIQRALVANDSGFISYREPANEFSRTQDLVPTYHDAGMFYVGKTSVLLREKTMLPRRTVMLELPEECVQDIDTPDDWRIAELKYKMAKGNVQDRS